MAKETGLPLMLGITEGITVPHTITYATLYRRKINSFGELPKDKQPPRNLWDKPYRLSEYLDEVFDIKGGPKKSEFIEFDEDDIE